MRVLKFGGSSVGSADRIRQVINIVRQKHEAGAALSVVVSAFGGVTDQLISLCHQAAHGDEGYKDTLNQIKERHYSTARELAVATEDRLSPFFHELEQAVYGMYLVHEASPKMLDFVMSFGERLSAFIISMAMAAVIPTATFLDARTVVKTDNRYGNARVNFAKTNALIKQEPAFKGHLPVITGFIGSTDENETTTLGRGGSDYTAAIFGAALKADEIEIWTDVNGVMTANPRKVSQAFPIPTMSYKEALELSHFGAKVIHPPTIAPALHQNIPLLIKNTFHPEHPGTFISNTHVSGDLPICGISSIDDVTMMRVEGAGLVGVCGIAMRLFGALARKDISVILISQGSSEHSICFAIAPQHTEHAKQALEEEFALEMHSGLVDPIVVEKQLSVIAVVGENMRHSPGVAGTLFTALGKNGVNVVAIVQGSSEYNITVVVNKGDEAKALNVIHEEFFLSSTTTLHLYLVGIGLIGKTLLKQMETHLETLRKEHAVNIQLVGIANSKQMYFDPKGIAIAKAEEFLENSPLPMHTPAFVEKMKGFNLNNSVFVDCTSDADVADAYPDILKGSISIVTPNKKANSASYERYVQLQKLSSKRSVSFYYETNVGAGLPIISTIKDLHKSGDTVFRIEAILSGTLSYLFNSFGEGKKFSEAVLEAKRMGFTEPDPRDDLDGNDLKRKILILARECGYALELDDVRLEQLLPKEFFQVKSVDEFIKKLPECDAIFEKKREEVAKEGKVLRYICSLENGEAKISLVAVDKSHPFYHLKGSDNVIAITTERYKETPLVIKGAGAGAEVTAGEVFADIVRTALH